MPHHIQTTIAGEVTELFAHRFVVRTQKGAALADLGPEGAERIALSRGDRVTIEGSMRPSEIKVERISVNGGEPVDIGHHKPHPGDHREHADPARALATAAAHGFTAVAQPRRKPKHFEILGRDAAGGYVELHIELAGALRKTRPLDRADPKWAAEIGNIY